MSKIDFSFTRLKQLSDMLSMVSKDIPSLPKSGWLSEVRTALMMSAVSVARKLGVDPSVVSRLEKSEAEQTITLGSLNRYAEVLGCKVVYVLVPKIPLDEFLMGQVKKVLAAEDRALSHTMKLENQEPNNNHTVREDLRAAFLLHEKGAKIWND